MAIIKKKMAGKPMMKKRKAQGGINLAKDPNTDEKNALKDVPSEGKMLSNVNTKERGSAFSTAAKSVKNFLKEDFLGAKDPGRTAVGKTLRKVGNTAIKTAYAPHQVVGSLVGVAAGPLMGKAKITGKDKAEGNLYYSNPKERASQKASSDSTRAASSSTVAKKKMGGKVAKKMAPKMMMMKKMSKKK